jgi:hypothetical protein
MTAARISLVTFSRVALQSGSPARPDRRAAIPAIDACVNDVIMPTLVREALSARQYAKHTLFSDLPKIGPVPDTRRALVCAGQRDTDP